MAVLVSLSACMADVDKILLWGQSLEMTLVEKLQYITLQNNKILTVLYSTSLFATQS